jgi:hypothetical protein
MTLQPLPSGSDAELATALGRLRDAILADAAATAADLSAATGWPALHAAEAVRRALAPFHDPALRRLVRAAGGRAPRPGSWLLAILAGRIPALATGAVFGALAARVPICLKPSSAEPSFAARLARTAHRFPGLAGCVALLERPSGDPAVDAAIRSAPACLVYGTDATVDSVLAARPGLATLAAGHRESFALVFREALSPDGAARLARGLALDIAIYDQGGCLSPHVVLAETGGSVSPDGLAQRLHDALVRVARALPAGPVPLPAAAASRLLAEEARLLARGGLARAWPPSGPVPPLVVRGDARVLRPGPGHRVVLVVPFQGTPALAELLPGLRDRVQGVALAGPRDRLRAALAAAPAWTPWRVAAPGRLQAPPAGWPENGVNLPAALAALLA